VSQLQLFVNGAEAIPSMGASFEAAAWAIVNTPVFMYPK